MTNTDFTARCIAGKALEDVAGKQDVIADLDTIRAGAAAGATAVQPADMTAALAAKQDVLTTEQLAAVNSGITSTDVAQIETNKNNILWNAQNGVANLCPINRGTTTGAQYVFDWTAINNVAAGEYTFSFNATATTGAVAVELGDSNTAGYTQTGYRIVTLPAHSGDLTVNAGTRYIRVFTNVANSITNIRLIPKSLADTPYQPYAMSNADITAWILAHS